MNLRSNSSDSPPVHSQVFAPMQMHLITAAWRPNSCWSRKTARHCLRASLWHKHRTAESKWAAADRSTAALKSWREHLPCLLTDAVALQLCLSRFPFSFLGLLLISCHVLFSPSWLPKHHLHPAREYKVVHNPNWVRCCSCCSGCQEAQTAEHQHSTTRSALQGLRCSNVPHNSEVRTRSGEVRWPDVLNLFLTIVKEALRFGEITQQEKKKKTVLILFPGIVMGINIIFSTELSEKWKKGREQHLHEYSGRLQSFLQAEWRFILPEHK